jgi:hypothetical protein
MYNVQNCDSDINTRSLETYKPYLQNMRGVYYSVIINIVMFFLSSYLCRNDRFHGYTDILKTYTSLLH